MHRTTITAVALIGVAAWTVTGCVSVDPLPVPSSPARGGGPARVVEPQIVQGPAREVLEAPPPAGT
ncbi:hypothetical protein HRW20_12235, partial [Streptomyces lunaelactis]|nr:hypothetical protein [Streptomyces lunaelactis]